MISSHNSFYVKTSLILFHIIVEINFAYLSIHNYFSSH